MNAASSRHELAGVTPGKASFMDVLLLRNLAGASASALFRSGAQFKNYARVPGPSKNKGLGCADYTCGMGSRDHRINDLLICFTWNTRRRRRTSRRLSPKG
jgi:hypothetical protein